MQDSVAYDSSGFKLDAMSETCGMALGVSSRNTLSMPCARLQKLLLLAADQSVSDLSYEAFPFPPIRAECPSGKWKVSCSLFVDLISNQSVQFRPYHFVAVDSKLQLTFTYR